MATPQSTARDANAISAFYFNSESFAFTSIAAGATTVFTQAVGRNFKPNKPITVVFPSGLQAGLVVGACSISGNSPSSGASPAFYQVNIPITNTTGAAIVPTNGPILVTQD